MTKDFIATIGGARGEEWERVLGLRRFCVQSPFPKLASLPGRPRALVYMLDLAEITPCQREALISHLAGKFRLAREEVERDLDAYGVPILDEDVSVAVSNPQRWFG